MNDDLCSFPEMLETRYKYSPLRRSRAIRLLRVIATGNSSKPMSYAIVTVDSEDWPSFSALSYTWGSPFLNGRQNQGEPLVVPPDLVFDDGTSLEITQNLSSALSHFQQLKFVGYFWVDSICINQEDAQERESQVAIMGAIYANASKVIVWLGEEDWNSKVAVVFLNEFLPSLEALQKSEGKSQDFSYSFANPVLYERLDMEDIPTDIFDGLACFLERAWFGRVWTFQDALLASDIEMLCGLTSISWDQLKRLLRFLEISDWDFKLTRFRNPDKLQQIPGRMINILMKLKDRFTEGVLCNRGHKTYLERNTEDSSVIHGLIGLLDQLLYNVRLRKASDTRDHVYGIFGITSRLSSAMNIRNPLPKPDYSKSTAQVFTAYSKSLLGASNSLFLLSNVEDRVSKSGFDLPSWVPDFSQSGSLALSSYGAGDLYQASKGVKARFFASSLEILSVAGFYCDEVLMLGDSDFEIGNGHDPFTKSAEMLLSLSVTYPNGQDRTEAFWRTLVADQANGQSPAPPSLRTAFYEYMLMHNSMFLLNSETAGNIDMTRIEPLAKLAETSSKAAELIPSFDKIVERKVIYQRIKAADERRNQDPSFSHTDLSDLKELTRSVLVEEEKALPFSRLVRDIFASKRTLKTGRGYIGLGHLSVHVGDQIWVLPGARVPFVFRRLADGRYLLIGEAYIHGLMRGEAFEFMNSEPQRLDIV